MTQSRVTAGPIVSTTSLGRAAESAATNYLINQHFQIVSRNWKTRWCEIDLIAIKSAVIYFVEVKYRATQQWGDGVEYITSSKLRDMHRAALLWVSAKNYDGDYELATIAVSGAEFAVDKMVVIT